MRNSTFRVCDIRRHYVYETELADAGFKMPKYYCDYCDTYLTHDSPSVRKTHNTGRKHKDAVKAYYMSWLEREAQNMMSRNPFLPRPGGGILPPPGMMPPPGMLPPPMHPGMIPQMAPRGMPPPGAPVPMPMHPGMAPPPRMGPPPGAVPSGPPGQFPPGPTGPPPQQQPPNGPPAQNMQPPNPQATAGGP